MLRKLVLVLVLTVGAFLAGYVCGQSPDNCGLAGWLKQSCDRASDVGKVVDQLSSLMKKAEQAPPAGQAVGPASSDSPAGPQAPGVWPAERHGAPPRPGGEADTGGPTAVNIDGKVVVIGSK